MRRLQVPDDGLVKTMLRAAIGASPDAVYLHRLYCVALVCAGLTCDAVAAAFGDDRRSVQRWVRRYRDAGIDGLRDGRPTGRPRKLGALQLQQLRSALDTDPGLLGHPAGAWNAEILCLEIQRRFGIVFSARHCARLLAEHHHAGDSYSAPAIGEDDTEKTT